MAKSKIEKKIYCYKICFLQCSHSCRALSSLEVHIRLSGRQQPCDISGHFNGRGLLTPERWETSENSVEELLWYEISHYYSQIECKLAFIFRSDIFRMTDSTLFWKIKYGTAFQNGLFCLSAFLLTHHQDNIQLGYYQI